MTIKSKTRKAAASKQAPGDPKLKVSVICGLISRWRLLEAECMYLLETKTDEEANRLSVGHLEEKRNIEITLSKLVPRDLWSVMELLEFATEMVEQGGCDDLEVKMLKHAKEGVRLIWRTESKAQHLKRIAARAA